MTATYFTIPTDVGNAKDANAKALGLPRRYTALAIGDGGGDNAPVPTPKPSQKALLGEWRRAALNTLEVDPKNPAQLIAEQVIPENEGGKWIREMGLYDEDGDLCYVCNAPPTYKPLLAEGSGKTQSVRMVIINTTGVNVELKIDPSLILATRDYADKSVTAAMKVHTDAPDPHPQYLQKAKGGAIGGAIAVTGSVTGTLSKGALIASNVGGTGQTSIFLTRDGAPVNYKTWELFHGSDGSFALRQTSEDYTRITTTLNVSIDANGLPSVMRLMSGGGRVLVNTSTDDNVNALQVKGGAVFDTPAPGDRTRRGATTEFVGTQLDGFPKVYSILALPTKDVGPITVAEVAEIWLWSASQYFTGYRSPLCGRPVDGHTVNPLRSELDAVGGTLSKSAYAALWGYAQENGLVVASGAWLPGLHKFVDLGGDSFRVPDLRNQFRRYTGTDADTANARTLGSGQADQLRAHSHPYGIAQLVQSGTGASAITGGITPASSTANTGGAETRPVNVAYAPRIHV